jgi:hypothetical protein
MKIRSPSLCTLIAVAVCMLSGCASTPLSSNERVATEVKVYQPDQLLPNQYKVVRYLWVDSWHAAFWLPSYSSEREGIAALQSAAQRLGANGLINVSCIDQGRSIWSWRREPSIVCNGTAINVH